MKILIAEDDFLSRKLLNTFLMPYGTIDHAANGKEAIEAVAIALEENRHYDLICLDIMMPKVDGLHALKKIRQLEQQGGVSEKNAAKIFMVTALSDKENVVTAAKFSCDAFLIKPLSKPKILERMEAVGLLEEGNE